MFSLPLLGFKVLLCINSPVCHAGVVRVGETTSVARRSSRVLATLLEQFPSKIVPTCTGMSARILRVFNLLHGIYF
jgi:hypothetical protein